MPNLLPIGVSMWMPFEEVDYHSPLGEMDQSDNLTVHANNLYVVIKRGMRDGCVWLSIRSVDNTARHDWRHFQRIKNELVGPEIEGLEVYPSESRLVDTSNQFHIWCLPPGSRIPFGFGDRLVSEAEIKTTKQRKFEDFMRPPDLVPKVEMVEMLNQKGQ